MRISSTLSNGFLNQYLAALTATITMVVSGMHYGWPSPSLEQLLQNNSSLHLSDDEGSWLAVMPLIGALLGSTIAASVVDILGRKKSILFTEFPFLFAWILIAFGKSQPILFLARIIAGLAEGFAFTALPMYIAEISDPKIRGMLSTSITIAWIFGMLLINIIGSYLTIQMTAIIAAVLPVVAFITYCWMPESPYYLIIRGDQEKARSSLQTFRGSQNIDQEFERITTAVKSQMQNTRKFLDLFLVKSNRKALGILIGLRTTQQLSGITAITFYTKLIFEEAGSGISSTFSAIIYFSLQVVTTFVCSCIVDKVGRRPLLISSIFGSAVFLFIEGTYFYIKTNTNIDVSNFSLLPIIALIGFVIIFSMGMQSIPLLILGELFPANVKAFGLCFGDIYFSIIATIVSKSFQWMKDNWGIYTCFYTFTASSIAGLIYIILVIPETTGKTLEDIQNYLKVETNQNTENKISEVK